MAKNDTPEDILRRIIKEGTQTAAVEQAKVALAQLEETKKQTEILDKIEKKKDSSVERSTKKTKEERKEYKEKEEGRLSRVTQKVSSGRGSTRGTMGNIADVISRGTIAASVGSVPDLRGVAAATLDAAGVGEFFALGGGKGKKSAASTSGGGKNPGKESVGILESILNVLQDNNELLQDLLYSLTAAAKGRIEDEREKEKVNKEQAKINTAGADSSSPANKGIGGVLGGFFKGGLAKILGPIEMMLSGLIGPLMNLAKFALRINPITAIFGAAVFSLNETDWQEIFGSLSTIFDDLTKGNWISALSTAIALIPDILIKGIGRLIANVLEWLGFEKESKELNSFITNLDIITPVKEGLIALFDTIVLAVQGIMRSYVGNFLKLFADINKLVDQIFSGDILGALDTSMQVVVRYFTMIPDMIIQGVGNLLAGIMDYFGFKEAAADIKEFLATFNLGDFVIEAIHLVIADIKFAFTWLKEKASNILTTITTWWNSWTISDVIITAFNDFKTKVGGLLAPVIEWWDSWTLVDIISTAFENFKTNVGNILAPVIEWWNSWSITGAITTAFEDFKQKILAYFGPEFVAKIGEIANFDLAGYISKKIGEAIDTVKNMFANLGSIVNDYAYDLWESTVGEFLPNPLTKSSSVPDSESETGMAAGRGAKRSVLAAVKNVTNSRPSSISPRVDTEPTFNNQEQPTFTGSASANFGNSMADLMPIENPTAPAFLKRANDIAVSDSAPAAPIIIDNSTKNNVTNSRPSSISPRVSSGAPSTAPVMSHIDRFLYPFIGAYP